MKTPCSLMLLLALTFLMLLAGAAVIESTQRCSDDALVLRDGEARITADNGTKIKDGYFFKTVYLWPEEGFKGVALQAFTDTATGPASLATWFPEDMFPALTKAAWWELGVAVVRWSDRVVFGVHLGDSWKVCFSWVTSAELRSLEVVGYGASRWRHDPPPPGCHYQDITPVPWPEESNCTAPPIITLATPPATPSPPPPPATPSPPPPPATPSPPTLEATTCPPTLEATTCPPTLEATTCPPIPGEVAEMMAALTVLIGDMYHTLQRLEMNIKGARGPAWVGTDHARPPQSVWNSPASRRN